MFSDHSLFRHCSNTLIAGLLVSTICASASGVIRRVDITAAPGGSGATWATAINTLQAGLSASQSGDDLWVARGTYKPTAPDPPGSLDPRARTFTLRDEVKVYGGFLGLAFGGSGETLLSQRNPETNITILSGDLNGDDVLDIDPLGQTWTYGHYDENCFNVVTALDGTGPGTQLNGFRITGGMANGPAGLDHFGGGLVIDREANPTIVRCTFVANRAVDGWGGGAGIFNSDVTISNPVFVNCTFIANEADHGGGMANAGRGGVTLINCLFFKNRAESDGGGYDFYSTSPLLPPPNGFTVLTNCTFSRNHAGNGGGLFSLIDFAPFTITNCILWKNRSTAHPGLVALQQASILSDLFLTFNNNCIQDNVPGDGHIDAPFGLGSGNIDLDPMFCHPGFSQFGVDLFDFRWAQFGPAWGSFRLNQFSPCIDRGDNAIVPSSDATDLDGDLDFMEQLPWDLDKKARIFGFATSGPGTVDMGAFEFPFRQGCREDLNGDCRVDTLDLGILLSSWSLPTGTSPGCGGATPCPADLNCDDIVDSLDLGILLAAWTLNPGCDPDCPMSGSMMTGGGGSAQGVASGEGIDIVPPFDPELLLWLMTADIDELLEWYDEITGIPPSSDE